jgi:hypothetical protein
MVRKYVNGRRNPVGKAGSMLRGRFGRVFRWPDLVLLVVTAAAGGWFGLQWHREKVVCLQRGAALDARLKKLETDATSSIGIGTGHDDIVRFLEKNGFSINSGTEPGQPVIVGTASDVGCPRIFGCGNSVFLRVEVRADAQGRAISALKVEGMYSDCL